MSFLSFIGWLVVTGAVVALLIAGKKRAPEPHGETPETETEREKKWCDAIGELCGGAVLIFDEGLCLLCSGGENHPIMGAAHAGGHLVDIVPQAILPAVMETIAEARRRGRAVWGGIWAGTSSHMSVIQKDGGKFLVHLNAKGAGDE